MYRKCLLLSLLFIFLLIGIKSQAQNAPTANTIIKKSDNNEVTKDLPNFHESTTIFQKIKRDSFFEVVIKTNFDSLLKNKKVSTKKYPGTIYFKNAKGKNLKLGVKIEPRGRSRRRVCTMPPLKLDFSKKELAKIGLFPGCDKLKLVTHCLDNEESDQVLIKEFWSYRLYNQITPQSFQVFPVKITYVNSNNTTERIERVAFFIENNDELAYRLNGKIISGFGTTADKLEKKSYHNTLMFQYMIGNVDWDIAFNRNVKFVQPTNDSMLIVIPYDFDYAALVKAPYARLNPDLNQKKIEDRFCLGKFSDRAALDHTIQRFIAMKKDKFECYNSCPILSKSLKKKMKKYISSFFDILKDDKKLEEIFLGNS